MSLYARRDTWQKQNFCDCQSCGWAEIADKHLNAEKIVFYHLQDAEAFSNGPYMSGVLNKSLFLAWTGDGNEICDIARACGLIVEWNGQGNTRIAIQP